MNNKDCGAFISLARSLFNKSDFIIFFDCTAIKFADIENFRIRASIGGFFFKVLKKSLFVVALKDISYINNIFLPNVMIVGFLFSNDIFLSSKVAVEFFDNFSVNILCACSGVSGEVIFSKFDINEFYFYNDITPLYTKLLKVILFNILSFRRILLINHLRLLKILTIIYNNKK